MSKAAKRRAREAAAGARWRDEHLSPGELRELRELLEKHTELHGTGELPPPELAKEADE